MPTGERKLLEIMTKYLTTVFLEQLRKVTIIKVNIQQKSVQHADIKLNHESKVRR